MTIELAAASINDEDMPCVLGAECWRMVKYPICHVKVGSEIIAKEMR